MTDESRKVLTFSQVHVHEKLLEVTVLLGVVLLFIIEYNDVSVLLLE